MRFQITARRSEVPDSVRERAEQQVRKLAKYEPRLAAAEVVFETEKHLKLAEAILSIDRDEPVVAQGSGPEFRAALDQMLDRLAKILRRRRSQIREHKASKLSEAVALEE